MEMKEKGVLIELKGNNAMKLKRDIGKDQKAEKNGKVSSLIGTTHYPHFSNDVSNDLIYHNMDCTVPPV